jgi:hypothetical protein
MKIRKSGIALICGAILMAVPALAQESATAPKKATSSKHEVTTKGQQSRGSGEDSNIKSKAHENSKDNANAAPEPPAKSVRGLGCYVDVNNATSYYIDIYSNGIYQGTVGPWANFYTYPTGNVSLYARADFTDGSYEKWGPNAFDCGTSGAAHNEWRLQP